MDNYIIPYLKNDVFYIEGTELKHGDVNQIIVSEAETSIENLVQKAKMLNRKRSFYLAIDCVVAGDKEYVKIITSEILKEGRHLLDSNLASFGVSNINNKKVFIVYGHDENSELKVANFISTLNLEPVVLSEKANGGKTIIEKLEENSDVGFAVVLYTPDDMVKIDDFEEYKQPRPNVIFEYGYFMAKLGRDRVALLLKEEIKEHSDILGTAYIKIDENNGWKLQVAKELKAAGYKIDLNKIL